MSMEWIRQSWLDALALTADWMRSPDFIEDMEGIEEMYGYCSQSFLGVRPTETPYELQPCQADGVTGQEGMQVGDTVRVTAAVCSGLVGELKVIEPNNDDEGDFFGIAFDGVGGYVFFAADEIERVENVDREQLPF